MSATPYQAAIFGATSAICISTLRAMLQERPARLLIVGRNIDRLEAVANDLRARGAECTTKVADFSDHRTDWSGILRDHSHGRPWDLFLIAQGTMPDQEAIFAKGNLVAETLDINFTSPAVIAAACAGILAKQTHGTLAVFGSVAGDRGRGSNFIYGSAKAGLDVFLAGMRHRFAENQRIRIVTLKPGMTDSPMTAHLPKGPLFSPADKVGTLAWKRIQTARSVAYLPGWWSLVMMIIRHLPENILHRSKL
jgi:hypothetical protein